MVDSLNKEPEKSKDANAHCDNKKSKTIVAGFAVTETAQIVTKQAAKKFAKRPYNKDTRTQFFDDTKAKQRAIDRAFGDKNIVRDRYTGQDIVRDSSTAKALYGFDGPKHAPSADHKMPLKSVYEAAKDKAFVTDSDIKRIANKAENLTMMPRNMNSSKQDKSNSDYLHWLDDPKSQNSKKPTLTEEGKEIFAREGAQAESFIKKEINKANIKGMVRTGHEAGLAGAKSAGVMTVTMSGIMNIVAVIKGEKDVKDALIDTAKDGGKAALTGYVTSAGLTVVSHQLSYQKSEFIQALVKSNVPGKVITCVVVMGDTLARYGKGEITTQECLIELGDKGVNFAAMGPSMAVGQALIPIPIVGAAIGAVVGSALASACYHAFINMLQQPELEHQERLRIMEACKEAAEQTKAFRMELDAYLKEYFKEYQDCFDEAIEAMQFSFQTGDADGLIAGANQITAKLGGQVHYENVDEFKEFFDDTETDKI